MKFVHCLSALALAFLASTPMPATAAIGAEVRLIAAASIPPTPPEPAAPPRFKLLVESISRVDFDRARFISGVQIARQRVQALAGFKVQQCAASAVDISITRGVTPIASFRVVFAGMFPDVDNAFELENGQQARVATWELVRKTNNGFLLVDEGGFGTVNQEVPGHPGIPAVAVGDLVTYKIIKAAGTANEVVTKTYTSTFE